MLRVSGPRPQPASPHCAIFSTQRPWPLEGQVQEKRLLGSSRRVPGRGVQRVPEGTYMEPEGSSRVYLGAWEQPSGCGRMPWGLVWKLYFVEKMWFYLAASEEPDFTEKCFGEELLPAAGKPPTVAAVREGLCFVSSALLVASPLSCSAVLLLRHRHRSHSEEGGGGGCLWEMQPAGSSTGRMECAEPPGTTAAELCFKRRKLRPQHAREPHLHAAAAEGYS